MRNCLIVFLASFFGTLPLVLFGVWIGFRLGVRIGFRLSGFQSNARKKPPQDDGYEYKICTSPFLWDLERIWLREAGTGWDVHKCVHVDGLQFSMVLKREKASPA
jgi:hypothetical protein